MRTLNEFSNQFQNISCLRFIYSCKCRHKITKIISKHFMFKVHNISAATLSVSLAISKHFMFKVHFISHHSLKLLLQISKHFMFKVHNSRVGLIPYFNIISKHFMFKVHSYIFKLYEFIIPYFFKYYKFFYILFPSDFIISINFLKYCCFL